MIFSFHNCKGLHRGSNSDRSYYSWNCFKLLIVNEEKDLEVSTSRNLKPDKHSSEVAKIANKLIAYIRRAFELKSEEVVLKQFDELVRS